MTKIVPVSGVRIIDGPGLILPNAPLRRPERIPIGLYDRNGAPAATSSAAAWSGVSVRGGYVKGMVVNVNHADLQPDASDQDFVSAAIDDGIAEADALGLEAKVRIFYGSAAADWLKAIGGPFGLTEPISGNPFTIGAFWDDDYVEAHRLCVAQVAERYNASAGADGPLREVAISGMMTRYAEQDIRQNKLLANQQAFAAAGYTLEADLAGQRSAIDAHLPLRCVSSRACNPFQVADEVHNVAQHTLSLMEYARTTLGLYGSLGNNSDRVEEDWPSTKLQQIYDKITELGPPAYIQTAAVARVGDLHQTCLKAVGYGATSIELPGTTEEYTSANPWGMTPAQFDEINASLASNAAAIGYTA